MFKNLYLQIYKEYFEERHIEKFIYVLWIIGLVVAGLAGVAILFLLIEFFIDLFNRIKYGGEFVKENPLIPFSKIEDNCSLVGFSRQAWILPYCVLNEKHLPKPNLFEPVDILEVVPNEDDANYKDAQRYLHIELVPDYVNGTFSEVEISTESICNNVDLNVNRMHFKFSDGKHGFLFELDGGSSFKELYEEYLNKRLKKCVDSNEQKCVKKAALSDFKRKVMDSLADKSNISFSLKHYDFDTLKQVKYVSCDLEFYVYTWRTNDDGKKIISKFNYVGMKHIDDIELATDSDVNKYSALGLGILQYRQYQFVRDEERSDYIKKHSDFHNRHRNK